MRGLTKFVLRIYAMGGFILIWGYASQGEKTGRIAVTALLRHLAKNEEHLLGTLTDYISEQRDRVEKISR